jgi:3',5'-nucleoside bisphosphate phosphatase
LLVDHCAETGLLTTGSSDFHGPDHHTFSRFRAFDLYGLEPTLGPLAD